VFVSSSYTTSMIYAHGMVIAGRKVGVQLQDTYFGTCSLEFYTLTRLNTLGSAHEILQWPKLGVQLLPACSCCVGCCGAWLGAYNGGHFGLQAPVSI
jgi:hypothetical protein